MLFRKRKRENTESFDRTRKALAVRASICTGERVAGFVDLETGNFEEAEYIGSDAQLQDFMKRYGIREDELKKIY